MEWQFLSAQEMYKVIYHGSAVVSVVNLLLLCVYFNWSNWHFLGGLFIIWLIVQMWSKALVNFVWSYYTSFTNLISTWSFTDHKQLPTSDANFKMARVKMCLLIYPFMWYFFSLYAFRNVKLYSQKTNQGHRHLALVQPINGLWWFSDSELSFCLGGGCMYELYWEMSQQQD